MGPWSRSAAGPGLAVEPDLPLGFPARAAALNPFSNIRCHLGSCFGRGFCSVRLVTVHSHSCLVVAFRHLALRLVGSIGGSLLGLYSSPRLFCFTILAQFLVSEARAVFGCGAPNSRRWLTFTRRSLLATCLAEGADTGRRGWLVV